MGVCFFTQHLWRSDASTDFDWWSNNTDWHKGVSYWGFVDIAPHLGGSAQKLQFLVFSSQTHTILKVSYCQNCCIDCNQILHSNRDHQVYLVIQSCAQQIQDGGRPPFWKSIKSSYLCTATVRPILMKFGTMTYIGPYNSSAIKISNFWKFKMVAATVLKITKNVISIGVRGEIDLGGHGHAFLTRLGWSPWSTCPPHLPLPRTPMAISQQQFDLCSRNLLHWCKMGVNVPDR